LQPNLQRAHQPIQRKDAILLPQAIPLPQTQDHPVRLPSCRCDRFYDIKSTISTRGAGFGYGHKYDFTKESPASPPPNSYHLDRTPDKKTGFAFGESRERMMITGPLVDTIQNKNPGPGNY
jgi:hypothetical protein